MIHLYPGAPTTAETQEWPEQGQWTYEEWLRLPDDGFRYEVLDGELYVSPPPTTYHQNANTMLAARMRIYADDKRLGLVLAAPTGVRLPHQPVPVQPDILFVAEARRHIVGQKYIEGVPDLVVEVLSPSNWTYDRRKKLSVYEDAGVPEYWIVDGRARTVEVLVLEEGNYLLQGEYHAGDVARSTVLAGFTILVDELFAL